MHVIGAAQICQEAVPWLGSKSLTSRRCAHRYCPECTTAYIDSALNDGKLHLRCPGAAGSGSAGSST